MWVQVLKKTVSHDYSRRLTNKILLIMTSSENNSERFALGINLWQPWGDFLISPLIHALSSDHMDIWHGKFSWRDTKRLRHNHKHTQAASSGADGVPYLKSTQWSSLRAFCISITCLMNRGQAYLWEFILKTWFPFLLCFYNEMNMFNPSWTLHGWNSRGLQWALCVRDLTSS